MDVNFLITSAIVVLINIISGFLYLILQLFLLVSFVFPVQIIDSVSYFLSYAYYLRGFIDVDSFFTAFGFYLVFLTVLYTIKLLMWAYGHLPFVGRHIKFPKLRSSKV